MALLSKDQIVQIQDLPRELVAVPEWGGEVYVRGMTSRERDEYRNDTVRLDKTAGGEVKVSVLNNEAMLAVRCMVGEDGKRLFADADAEALAAKSAVAVHRIVAVAERLSGISADAVKDAEKNSETTQP